MHRFTSAIIAACFLAVGQQSLATPTENRQIRVLPTPGPVTIDGAVDDWDLSGGTFGCDDVENLRDRGHVWFHLMHDDEALYVLGRFRDQTPLNNPRVKAAGQGWGGDCLQVRMITDRTLHLTAWQDADGLPLIDIYYGIFARDGKEGEVPDALAAGAKMAFRLHQDGGGYNQEIALPWTLLTRSGKRPEIGQSFRLTWEGRLDRSIKVADLYSPSPDRIFTFRSTRSWGSAVMAAEAPVDPVPVLLADGRQFAVTMADGQPRVDWTGLLAEEELPGHLPLAFTLERDAYVTLAIDDADGKRVRNLVSSRFLTAGQHTLFWDGLTDNRGLEPGQPVEPGTYRWRGLSRDSLNLVYRGHYHNAGEPPWSNFGRSSDWGGDHGTPCAAVSDGRHVYLGWSGGEASTQLIAVNPRTFRKVWGARRMYSGNQWLAIDGKQLYSGPNKGQAYTVDNNGSFLPFPATGTADLALPDGLVPEGLVVIDGLLHFADRQGDALAVVDPATAQIVRRLPLPAPGRLTRDAAGAIWAISARQVVQVDPKNGTVVPVVTDGLDDPRSLCLGPDGAIYVADWGNSQQVKVFAPDGQLRQTIGKPGGRASRGPWEATALRQPLGLTVDFLGQLWVGEAVEHPRRWSVWSADGELLKELFGPSHYGADGGALHPADPYLAVGMQCEWRVDPESGRANLLGVVTSPDMTNVPFPVDTAHSSRYFTVDGQDYLAQGLHRYWSMLKLFRRDGNGNFALVAVLGNADEYDGKRKAPLPYAAHPLFADRRGQLFAWSDLDGDGQVQAEEIQFREMPLRQPDRPPRQPLPPQPGERLRLRGVWQQLGLNNDFQAFFLMNDDNVWRFPIRTVTPQGVPVYDLAAAGPTYQVAGASLNSSIMPSHDGTMALVSANPLQAFAVDGGHRLWTYPNDWSGVHGSHSSPRSSPGRLRGIFAVVGNAHLHGRDFFMLNSNVGEWHCLTGDGLHVANLFTSDPTRVAWPEQATPGALLDNVPPGMGGEDFGGFFTGTRDGRAFIQAGKTGFWLVELTGLDSLADLPGGTVEQTAAGLDRSRDWQSRRRQQAAGQQRHDIVRATPTVDGQLDDWLDAWMVSCDFERGQPNLRAGLLYDDQFLYLAFQVADSSPWLNQASTPEVIYTSGDTVDFQIGVAADAPSDRTRAVPGDQRLSIGLLNGQPQAVLFREKGPTAPGGRRLKFSSGVVDEFWVESVSVMADARLAVTRAGRSYTVEAAIPLAALDLSPSPGLELRGDLGATFSNNEGNGVLRRAYWSNRNVGIVNDIVFELRLEPRNWGIFTFR